MYIGKKRQDSTFALGKYIGTIRLMHDGQPVFEKKVTVEVKP